MSIRFELTRGDLFRQIRDRVNRMMVPGRTLTLTTCFLGRIRTASVMPAKAPEYIFDCLCTPVQIVLHFVAEKPYFTEGETLRVTAPVAKAALTFPVTFIRGGGALASVIEESDFAVIQNPGDTDCPITAYLYAGGTVREPYIMLGDKKIRLTGNLAAGDTVKIESGDNRHRITVNGKARSDIDRRSRFFCLEPGENRVTVSASAGAPSLRSYFEFEPRYFGI